jgi:signal transduction histidine kinase
MKTGKAENSLKSSKEIFKSLFYEAQTAFVLYKGHELVYEHFNKKYEDIYGRNDMLGKKLLDAVPELKDSSILKIIKRVYDTGEPFFGNEILARLRNATTGELEERYFDTTFSRISFGDEEEYRVLASPNEVTDRVIARKKLERSLQELQEERDIRDRLVSALTHDLRTPFAVARVSAQLLKRKAENKESIFQISDKIISNMDRADRMIRDLLDANRIKSGEGLALNYQEVILNLTVEYVVSELEDLFGARFRMMNRSGEIKGQWDVSAIQRILENLASNAIKYGDKEAPVTITVERKGSFAVLSVHNEGEAISLPDQKNLFVQFHRTELALRSEQRGWGIGLSLVKGLAEAHGGSVGVKSERGHGTTFYVYLPLIKLKQ